MILGSHKEQPTVVIFSWCFYVRKIGQFSLLQFESCHSNSNIKGFHEMSSPTTEEFFFLSPLLLLFGSQEELGINLTLTKILAQLLHEAFACPLPGTVPALVSPIPVQKEAEVHGWIQNFCSRWTSILPLWSCFCCLQPLVPVGSCLTGKRGLLCPPKPIAEEFPGRTMCLPWKVSLMDFTGLVAQAETQLVFSTPAAGLAFIFSPFIFLFCWSAELKEGESFLALLWAVTASGETPAGGEAR